MRRKNGTITVVASRHPDGGRDRRVGRRTRHPRRRKKSKVFERFYRGDASRGTPGAGLGLSLVAAVAKLHGGVLKLTDNHPGLRATLVLFPSANFPNEPAAASMSLGKR
ncbi:sensor histidine kinase [Undibacterium arcticum]